MAARIVVTAGRHHSLRNLWSGTELGYSEMHSNLDFRRDRVMCMLNINTIHNRDDYYDQLEKVFYGDKRQQHAFRNWAMFNYGNGREYFFDKYILPTLMSRVKIGTITLKSGQVRIGAKLDEYSYIIPIKYVTLTGKTVEYLQRREFKTGRVMSSKNIFGAPIPL